MSTKPTADEFIERQKARPLPHRFKAKDIGRLGKLVWEIEAETYRPETNYPQKAFVIQRIRLVDIEGELLRPDIEAPIGDVQYRLAYYIVNAKGAWHWGQYCPFIPAADFDPLLEQARAEGTLLPLGT